MIYCLSRFCETPCPLTPSALLSIHVHFFLISFNSFSPHGRLTLTSKASASLFPLQPFFLLRGRHSPSCSSHFLGGPSPLSSPLLPLSFLSVSTTMTTDPTCSSPSSFSPASFLGRYFSFLSFLPLYLSILLPAFSVHLLTMFV